MIIDPLMMDIPITLAALWFAERGIIGLWGARGIGPILRTLAVYFVAPAAAILIIHQISGFPRWLYFAGFYSP
jgi:hypothetical protein